ncbi:MAG: hypothetical protein HY073_00960 [Deltaproteobacteria bacterium]|nr:hypothetical protein [Deltaproteobacteria bacterium]
MKSNLLIAVFLFGVSFLPFRVNAACNVITPQDTPVDLYYFAKLNSGGSCSFIKFRSYDVLFNVNTNSFLDDGYASPCSIPLSPYTKLHLSLDLLKTENTAFDYFRYIAGRIQSIGFICDDTVTIGAYNNGYGRIIYYPGFFRQRLGLFENGHEILPSLI